MALARDLRGAARIGIRSACRAGDPRGGEAGGRAARAPPSVSYCSLRLAWVAALAPLLSAGSAVAHAVALRFRRHLEERELAPAAINLRLSSIRIAVRLARISRTIDWELVVP
jgi:hypothetical protein